jgi:NADH dehydrogenase
MMVKNTSKRKAKILILGGGFAGVETARHLETMLSPDEAELQLVSRDNFVLFTPMLHEVAASDLDITTIVNPVRNMIRRTQFMQAEVQSIDFETHGVTVAHGEDSHTHRLDFDQLIIAMGSVTNLSGIADLESHALTMKSLEDAILLRNRMIAHLEEADPDCAAESRNALLTFVVVGGGFAGVETIGAMHDFLSSALRSYSNLRASMLRVVLVHSGPHLLPELGERLGQYAEEKLRARGIEILTQQKVASVTAAAVTLKDGTSIPTTFVVWTAGSAASPQIAALACVNAAGKLETNEMLQVVSSPGVWALGDCATVPDGNGGFHPPTAQHALRQARTLATNITATLRGKPLRPFIFKTLGQLAAIGRRTGVAQIMGHRISGFAAWWMWRTIYLAKLPRFEKRLHVALNWTFDLLFSKDTVQYVSFRATGDAKPLRALIRPDATVTAPIRISAPECSKGDVGLKVESACDDRFLKGGRTA